MSEFFAGTRPGREVSYGKARFELPILYQRTDAFMLFFACSAQRARALMPSPRLHPVTLPGGRAMVGLAAYNYLETTIGPYGEFAVGIPAVYGRRPPPRPRTAPASRTSTGSTSSTSWSWPAT